MDIERSSAKTILNITLNTSVEFYIVAIDNVRKPRYEQHTCIQSC